MAEQRIEDQQQVQVKLAQNIMHSVHYSLNKMQYVQHAPAIGSAPLKFPRPSMPHTPPSLTFRRAVPADAQRCFVIESTAYEGDEAATLEKIATRIAQYPEGFQILEVDGQIAGFINCGCAQTVVMSDEAFKELVGHDPAAPHVVIMSVVLDPACQGKGYARLMMQRFVEDMALRQKQSIHLMCKAHHVGLYERMGYRYVKPSPSDHGGMSWHEMVMPLPAASARS